MSNSPPPSRRQERLWRYLLPNLVTAVSMLCGLAAIFASVEGRFSDAGWWILYAVFTDKVDGFLARLVRGTSALGVQMDSLADFLNFGVAPPVLVFASLGQHPSFAFHEGIGRVVLLVSCAVWMLGAVFRLARFNVSSEVVSSVSLGNVFFGLPSTLAAGVFVTWYLALLKYTPPGHAMAVESFGGAKLLSKVSTPEGVWTLLPAVLFLGGVAMASNMRIPKLGPMGKHRWLMRFIFVNVFLGYVFGLARLYPEYLVGPPTAWVVVFGVWGLLSAEARELRAPPIFPREELLAVEGDPEAKIE